MFNGEINKGGRPKGSSNKVSLEVKEAIKMLLVDNIDEVAKRLQELKPSEFVKAYISLARFIVPTQKAITEQVTEEPKQFQIEVVYKDDTIEIDKTKKL